MNYIIQKHLEIFLISLVVVLTCYVMTKEKKIQNGHNINQSSKYKLLVIPVIFVILEIWYWFTLYSYKNIQKGVLGSNNSVLSENTPGRDIYTTFI